MKECKVFVPFGALGGGIDPEAFENAMKMKPDIISTDAGSTDSGPYYLGTGKGKYARNAVKRDMKMVLLAAAEAKIPVTIGTAGTCGSDQGVDEFYAIADEIARENNLHMKVTLIYTEQDREKMKSFYEEGSIIPLTGAPEVNGDTFLECSHIVALAGMEPFRKALEEGADVVICGRATDTAVIAAYPIMKGCDPASAWHAAKTAECGGICTTDPEGGVFLTIDEEGFTVESPSPNGSCTPYSISAHLLYENSDPVRLVEPGVVIDTSESIYTELEDGKVRITGTSITYTPYTMKLEGSSPMGYQTVSMVGIQDRDVMAAPMRWIKAMSKYTQDKLDKFGLDRSSYSYVIRPYGYNAVTQTAVPEGFVPNELAVVLIVNAKTQELATQVAKTFNPYLLHFPVHFDRQLPSFAFPYSPSECERGPVYAFRLYHAVKLQDPLELCRFRKMTIGEEQ